LPDQAFPANYPAPGQPVDELALAEIKGAILAKLRLAVGKEASMATKHDWYMAAALEAVTQTTRRAAAIISIINLMAWFSPNERGHPRDLYHVNDGPGSWQIGPVLA
jgi:hypothetical protein